MRLEDIQIKGQITGIHGDEAVTVVAIDWSGKDALQLFYKTADGSPGTTLLYRDDEERISPKESGRTWTFDGDGADFRLVSEAQRIRLAHLFDPHLAVHTSEVQPLPHQITAVYESMLPRQPLRFLLADDPGSGKTIMAGLLIRELMARGDVERCLIVCPGILVEQWQDELSHRFNLMFEILTLDKFSSAGQRNWFAEHNLVLARLDQLSRNDEMKALLQARGADWDLVVCDEAHKMSATYSGGEIKYTKRYQLGQMLSGLTRHLLLMTATPHNGKEMDFQLFMALLDSDRFEGRPRDDVRESDVTDLMRRMVKERLVKFNGKPLFPERRAYTVPYDLSQQEDDLYSRVTDYVREEFNRADNLGDEKRRGTVGFALTLLQRRLASSPAAIHESLRRRRERLETRLEEESGRSETAAPAVRRYGLLDEEALDDLEDAPGHESEDSHLSILDQATAARTIEELENEIRTLKRLEKRARSVRQSGTDTKWGHLAEVLDQIYSGRYSRRASARSSNSGSSSSPDSRKRKLVIFTEHVDTLKYLHDRINTRIGRHGAVVVIHGTVARQERLRRQDEFRNNPDVQILLATDAAGEGVNLQRAHFMVNYDLPWNPNRLEQRFGRIHRIGQTEVCHLWNLVAKKTREGDVYHRLLEKLDTAREALGGQVFDVLGKLEFDGKPLRQLLLEAIRYGQRVDVKARLDTVVDKAVNPEKLQTLLEDKRLVTGVMDTTQLEKVRLEMERAEARRLQPHYIESFFREAYQVYSTSLRKREAGRYELKYVPAKIRSRSRQINNGRPVPLRYERIAFEKERIAPPGKVRAAFISPGHPLLSAVIDLTLERYPELLNKGTILVDEKDAGTSPRVLFSINHSLQDGRGSPTKGRQTVSERLLFVEINCEGDARHIQYAPYLDYRPLSDDDPSVEAILGHEECRWLEQDLQKTAIDHAITDVVPVHLREVREVRLGGIAKTRAAVKDRLTRESNYWRFRASQLKGEAGQGKKGARLHALDAERKADMLYDRLKNRLSDLDLQAQLSPKPPVILGCLLVVPKGLIDKMQGVEIPNGHPTNTKESAKAARDAVMEIEKELGYCPTDREYERLGYDIESRGRNRVRFIEVKGRRNDADDIQVTRNEILYSLNKPDQYILAIVLHQEDGDPIVRYRRRPFTSRPDFGVTSVRYSLRTLMEGATDPLVTERRENNAVS